MDMNSHGNIRINCMDNTRFCANIRFHELAWRLRKKLVISKFKAEGETSHIEVSLYSTKSSPSDEFNWVWEDVIKEKEIPTTALRSRT
jgi:hypothetical protein